MSKVAPFPVQPELTAIAIEYKNKRMIADAVLPRTPVGTQLFRWWKYDLVDGITIPDTKVGRTGLPNKINSRATEETSQTIDHALEEDVPQADIDNAPPNHDPLGKATERIMNVIQLRHEVEVANLVFDAATYPADKRVTLAGTDQFSDFANSNPLDVLQTAIDAPLMTPRKMILGRGAWSIVKRHPKLVKAVYPISQGGDGMITREALRDLLEMEDIQVGEAFVNTARKGEPANVKQAWGKHISFIYQDVLAGPQSGTTFGFVAEFGNPVSGIIPDPHPGLRGVQTVKAGESVRPIISAPDLGYFIQDVA